MKRNILLSFIIAIINTLQTYAMDQMDSAKLPLLHYNSHNQVLMQYTTQINLPDDALDKIIAYSDNNRQNLKETCQQLSCIASINQLNQFIEHDFIIGDEKAKSSFFKALIKTSNPNLITVIMKHAQKEAECMFNNAIPDAVCIIIEPKKDITAKENAQITQYIQEHYLHPLLQEASKQRNTEMIARLEKENCDTSIIEKHKEQLAKERKQNIGEVCLITSIGTGMCGIFGFIIYLMITK